MMKYSSVRVPATALLAVAGILLMAAQNPPATGGTAPESYPAPTNLKVLPKDMSGAQVHELMEQWKTQLGMECKACHADDKEKLGANGRPVLNFADDSKPEKVTARVMYTMTEEINTRFIARIDSSGVPVSCGTCHRGHVGPEPMVIPMVQGKPQPSTGTSGAQELPRQ